MLVIYSKRCIIELCLWKFNEIYEKLRRLDPKKTPPTAYRS